MRFPLCLAVLSIIAVSTAQAHDLPLSTARQNMSFPPPCGTGQAIEPGPLTPGILPHCQALDPVKIQAANPHEALDDFRAIVRTGDIAKVKQTLVAAWEADKAHPKQELLSPQLYWAFTDLDPATDKLTQDWLAAQPDDPFALTARAAQLTQQGWVQRGNAYISKTWPPRIEKARDLHQQAYQDFQLALGQNPDFLPAANGLIQLTPTMGHRDAMLIVLEHVMQTFPNRGSLLSAMNALAPQWGGTQDQVDLVCDRYAPLLPQDPPYTADTCRIDAAYYGPYCDCPRFQAAHDALMQNDSPWLNGPRRWELLNSDAPPDQKLDALRKLQAHGPLGLEDARMLDTLVAQVTGKPPSADDAALPKAARYWVEEDRKWANNAPLSPVALNGLVTALNTLQETDGVAFPGEEIRDRALRVLAAFPGDFTSWNLVGNLIAENGTAPGQDEVTRLALAEPYFQNAIVYSQNDPGQLSASVDPKLRWLAKKWLFEATGPLPSFELPPGTEETIACPTIRQLKLLAAVCTANGAAGQSCGEWEALMNDQLKLQDFAKAGHCTAEFYPQFTAQLLYTPVPVEQMAAKLP